MSLIENPKIECVGLKKAIEMYNNDPANKNDIEINETSYVPTPLKWSGGRQGYLKGLERYYPTKDSVISVDKVEFLNKNKDANREARPTSPNNLKGIRCYIEPFMGSGANLFYIGQRYECIEQLYGGDILRDLFNFYAALRDYPKDLIDIIKVPVYNYNSSLKEGRLQYYGVFRDWFNEIMKYVFQNNQMISLERAGGFYFLNQICYSYYRSNQRGEFNSPFGNDYKDLEVNVDDFFATNKVLQKTYLTLADYTECESFIDGLVNSRKLNYDEVFVYLDPPSKLLEELPLVLTNNLKEFRYNMICVGELVKFCDRLTAKGIKWMLTIGGPLKDTLILNSKYKYFRNELEGVKSRGRKSKDVEYIVRNFEGKEV